MRLTELLSPAKDKETAIEAINAGADAIYMGASAFGARYSASNSIEDISEVVQYAHKFWAKVFVTVNTILTDEELNEAIELIKKLQEINVDAVIIQDMGLLKKIQEDSSIKIPLHISTQCDNREKEKVSFFNKLGLSRVVLARELSLDKIKEIHEANPNLELEAFIHGALCVSYSGQCYLSQYIGGRSANRGECAQPCRKKYTVLTDKGEVIAKEVHALCLKDFNASKHIQKMIENGVFSFKIEGRLKDKGYVKNITAYYRELLDKYSKKISSGKVFLSFTPNPEKSFNRGFTDYFLEKRGECFNFDSPKSRGEYLGKVLDIKKDCFRIQTSKKINPQDGLTFGTEGFLVNKVENGYIYPNKNINISKGTEVYRNQDFEFEKELAKSSKRQIGLKIEAADIVKLTDEDGICVEIEFPTSEKAQNQQKMNDNFVKQFSKTGESDFYIENIEVSSDIPFMPVSTLNHLRREGFEKLMQKRLEEYKNQVQKEIKYCPYYKQKADYRANVHNESAKEFYELCGCKITEPSLETAVPQREIELMRTKHCIKYALNMCKSPKNLVLKDEFGKLYPLKFDCKNCEMAVLAERKLLELSLTKENKNRVIKGNLPSETSAIKMGGVTHYAYSDCPAADLITIDDYPVHSDIKEAWDRMKKAAQTDWIDLNIVSGFRSISAQKSIFPRKFQPGATPSDEKFISRLRESAPPGFSEHHTGYAIDICSVEESDFEKGGRYYEVSEWLKKNARRFGFEQSFPENNSQGLINEPWHYRYVGTERAQETFAAVHQVD